VQHVKQVISAPVCLWPTRHIGLNSLNSTAVCKLSVITEHFVHTILMVHGVKMRLMVLLLLVCMPLFITALSAAPCELLFL